MLDGFNCFLPEVRALPFARHSTPVGGFLRVQGWGTASDTSRGGVRARVSAPISVAFSRAIIERGASMGSRQRPRGSSRARARATAPRPRVFSPIFPPSVLTRSPVPSSRAAVQVLHRDRRQGGRAGAPIRPARSPVARPRNARARIESRRVFFSRASLAASRGARPRLRAHPGGQQLRLAACLSRSAADFNPPPSGGRRARLGARRALLGRPDSPSPENDPFPPLRRPSRRSAAGTTSLSAFARCTATTSAPTTPSWLSSFGSETPSSPRNRCARDADPPARSPRPSPDAFLFPSRARS